MKRLLTVMIFGLVFAGWSLQAQAPDLTNICLESLTIERPSLKWTISYCNEDGSVREGREEFEMIPGKGIMRGGGQMKVMSPTHPTLQYTLYHLNEMIQGILALSDNTETE